jgi:hypothetical protein
MNKLKNMFRIALISACALSVATSVNAMPTADTSTVKKPTKAKSKTKKTASAIAAPDQNEAEPDVQNHEETEYKCELGNSMLIYKHPENTESIAMRWKKRLYKLVRVETSTGANRFENQKAGFLWIDIPAKGLLLDSLRGHQLANECKSSKTP